MQVRYAFPARGRRNVSAGLCVLVVDDEVAILRFLKPALEANGYQMSSAATVADAVKRIAADAPDVVLLDLGLPDGDGKDVIRRVREWSDVPVIVLSARDREAEKIESLDLGAEDYVNKPFNVAGNTRAIREMSITKPLWGAPRIHGELLKLGIEIGQTSVAKYMARRRGPPSQGRKTFLRNHVDGIAAMICSSYRRSHFACSMAC
jgi:CheY-like chemotaxis protein